MIEAARLCSILLLAVVSLTLLDATSLAAQDVLTNDAVIAMKKAGLSDSVIIAKIRASQTKFDVNTQALISLKGAGLSDQIIEAMVTHPGPAGSVRSVPAAPPAASPAAPPAAGAAGPSDGRKSIFHISGGRNVELLSASSSRESNRSYRSSKSELVLNGKKAQYRTPERQPVFLTAWAPNEVSLVRLTPGTDHDDRNLQIASGSSAPFSRTRTSGIRSEDQVDVEVQRDAGGLYRLTPRQPLPPGEYAFVLTYGGGAVGQVYDFGVD